MGLELFKVKTWCIAGLVSDVETKFVDFQVFRENVGTLRGSSGE